MLASRKRDGLFSTGAACCWNSEPTVCALHVPAHAVGHDHQQRVAGEAVAHAVLVRPATALLAFLVDREAHGQRP
jgi:hypothetical protein